ncbi:MAG: hypothetical protein J6J35_03595, partial [Alphaproteobacteria bacterium]|nr:hypothetical protein [Alphaproteobacteria bacterium]
MRITWLILEVTVWTAYNLTIRVAGGGSGAEFDGVGGTGLTCWARSDIAVVGAGLSLLLSVANKRP